VAGPSGNGKRLPVIRDRPSRDWVAFAACAGMGPSLFYPRLGSTGYPAAAKRICTGCPVRFCCLEWAVASGEQQGMWGGMGYRARRETTSGAGRQLVAAAAAAEREAFGARASRYQLLEVG
jgi:WhiB family redox-sensing transcriptional regulator